MSSSGRRSWNRRESRSRNASWSMSESRCGSRSGSRNGSSSGSRSWSRSRRYATTAAVCFLSTTKVGSIARCRTGAATCSGEGNKGLLVEQGYSCPQGLYLDNSSEGWDSRGSHSDGWVGNTWRNAGVKQ